MPVVPQVFKNNEDDKIPFEFSVCLTVIIDLFFLIPCKILKLFDVMKV